MKKALKVSAIVPVFNEEKTIENVVKTLISHPLVDEVICVDDGSRDKSPQILKSFGKNIVFVQIKKNKGKGYVLTKGIEAAKREVIMFLDADILNLSKSHVTSMLRPLNIKGVKVILGYPPTRRYLSKLFLPLTGERIYYKKDLLPHLSKMQNKGYGVEAYLNSLFPKDKVRVVKLKNLILLEKREKHGFQKSLRNEWKAWTQVSKETMKRDDLLTSDYQTIMRLKKIKNTREIILRINELGNRKVKMTLQRAFAEIFYD